MKTRLFLSLALILGIMAVATNAQAANTNSMNYGIGGVISGLGNSYYPTTNGRGATGMLVQLNSSQISGINGISSASNDVNINIQVGQVVSQIMNTVKSKKVDRLCAKTAMLKFEDATAEAWKTYAQANTDAFTAKRAAVNTAWDATNLSTGYRAVAMAYANFNKQKLVALKAYNKAKVVAIKAWTTETNACPLAGTAGLTPTISITAPATGATLASTSPITITAEAKYYKDGTPGIQEVIFYNGAEAINKDTSAPYTYDWTTTTVGSKTLTTSVLDKDGRRATSSAVTITVN